MVVLTWYTIGMRNLALSAIILWIATKMTSGLVGFIINDSEITTKHPVISLLLNNNKPIPVLTRLTVLMTKWSKLSSS